MIKLLGLSALSVCLLTPFAAHASLEDYGVSSSANVGFVSEYSFRGIAQSNENPALQGGFDLEHDSGVYAGVWASNVNFNDGDEAHMEFDLYGGFTNSIHDFNYDVGFIYYAYPGADNSLNYDFWEGSVAVGYDFEAFSTSVSVNYSPEYFGDSGDAFYYAAAVGVPLPNDFTLGAHVGLQTIDDEAAFFGTSSPEGSYKDWSVSLGYTLSGFDLSLQYVDTDLDEPSECADGCDGRAIFGVSRSF